MQEELMLIPQERVVRIQITNAQLVRKCIQEMNIEALYYLLDAERIYGDTYLNAVQGSCGGSCVKGQNGYLFIGNNSKNYMNLLFVEEELQLTDLYECSLFRTNFDNLALNKRYYIDPKAQRLMHFFDEFNKSLEP